MNQSRGFSLIELMIVVVILGLMATLLVPRIMDRPEEARVAKARVDMRTLESALRLYRLDNGAYPTTEQGLAALVRKPEIGPLPRNYRAGGYLEGASVPRDPWGRPYVYKSPGDHNTHGYDLYSYGPDGREGGDDDIDNWSER